MRRIDALPGVSKTAFRQTSFPWRDPGFGPGPANSPADGPRPCRRCGGSPGAVACSSLPGFFCVARRSYHCRTRCSMRSTPQNNDDQNNKEEPVVIVSETLAPPACFPTRMRSIGMSIGRIPCCNSSPGTDLEKFASYRARTASSVSPPIFDDAHVVPEPTLNVYSPFDEGIIFGGRLFIHTSANPLMRLVAPVTARSFTRCPPDQPVEHTLPLWADVRAEVAHAGPPETRWYSAYLPLSRWRIAVVASAGVLAFSVRRADAGIPVSGSPWDRSRGDSSRA